VTLRGRLLLLLVCSCGTTNRTSRKQRVSTVP
jgi:hypothetical protein